MPYSQTEPFYKLVCQSINSIWQNQFMNWCTSFWTGSKGPWTGTILYQYVDTDTKNGPVYEMVHHSVDELVCLFMNKFILPQPHKYGWRWLWWMPPNQIVGESHKSPIHAARRMWEYRRMWQCAFMESDCQLMNWFCQIHFMDWRTYLWNGSGCESGITLSFFLKKLVNPT
jgi:hypothetical protein